MINNHLDQHISRDITAFKSQSRPSLKPQKGLDLECFFLFFFKDLITIFQVK